jgi:hypothetical protein
VVSLPPPHIYILTDLYPPKFQLSAIDVCSPLPDPYHHQKQTPHQVYHCASNTSTQDIKDSILWTYPTANTAPQTAHIVLRTHCLMQCSMFFAV